MRAGIAGTGRMGAAIAERLIAEGVAVTVWNRTPARADALRARGADVAATPRDLARSVDVVITILSDAAAFESVYGGADGLLAGIAGRLVVEMSTVRPQEQRSLAGRIAAAGGTPVECPVGGTVGPAREGKLFGFAGGEPDAVAHARPLLEKLCRRIEHVGPIGAGAAMKLAINLPLMVYWQALGEAWGLIDTLGLEPERVVSILADTSGAPAMLKNRGPAIAQAFAAGRAGAPSVDIVTMRKDVRAMIDEGAALKRAMPVASAVLAAFDAAIRAGQGASDCTGMPLWWVRDGARSSAGN
ncbi:MAG: NAD(P)-dependent oxidoreductase [Burkholderiales bacterium]|nr:NAD(P)-dependent oxidoreductase [Burkholderiales bacterium]